MPLYMDRDGLRCFQADEAAIWRDAVPDAAEEVARWQSAFFAANGHAPAAAMDQVNRWLQAAERISFQQIAAHLLDALTPHHDLSALDLVVVAHWTPDCVMGFSVTNFILHRLQAEQAYAFAVSDCGRAAPFQAIALIDRYLPATQGTALLVTVDQPLLLQAARHEDARPSGAALLLDRRVGRFALQPCLPEEPLRGALLKGDPSRLSVAPFYALQQHLAADAAQPVRLSSADDSDGLLITPREAA